MGIEVRINWTPNEWRRFWGWPDVTPLVELTSELLDDAAMALVEHRLETLAMAGKAAGDAAPDTAMPQERPLRMDKRRAVP